MDKKTIQALKEIKKYGFLTAAVILYSMGNAEWGFACVLAAVV